VRAALCLTALAAGGCDYVFHLESVDSDAGVIADAAPSSACTFGPPYPLPTFTGAANDPSTTADKLLLYFALVEGDGTIDLWFATRDTLDEPYGDLTHDNVLASNLTDAEPALSADGLGILFFSERTGTRQIYEAHRTSRMFPFSSPVLVDTGPDPIYSFDASLDLDTLWIDTGGDLVELTRANDQSPFGARRVIGYQLTWPTVAGDQLSVYYSPSGTVFRQTRADARYEFSLETAITTGFDPDISADGRTLIVRTAVGLSELDCL
jgi:hypothetical protein